MNKYLFTPLEAGHRIPVEIRRRQRLRFLTGRRLPTNAFGILLITGLILLFASCISFVSLYSYAESEKDTSLSPVRDYEARKSSESFKQNVTNGVNLPQGVKPLRDGKENQDYISNGLKRADEKKAGASTVLNESSGIQQEEKSSAKTIEQAQEKDTFEDSLISEKESKKRSLSGRHDLAELRAYVDKSIITIGEKVTYTLEIDADNNLRIEFPSYITGLGGFGVKDFGKEEKKIGRNRTRIKQWYLLDTYTTGSYVIPPQQITVELPDGKLETLKSPEIFVEVKSVMSEGGEDAGLRDIKEPLTVKKDVPVILITAILLIILVAAGLILWRLYLKKIAAQKKEPVLSPDEIALGELERIEGLGLLEKSKIKEYYYLVSLALRTYLENRFSLKAPEQTTEEFLESVVNSGKLEARYINILKEYLNHCDLVKYAKFDPGKAQAKTLLETTRRFINETANPIDNSPSPEIRGHLHAGAISHGVKNKAEG